MSGLLHSAYLLGCWWFLRRAPGSAGARLLAFCTAILSVVFYAYAPYLSHDLLPGLLFLLLIFLCHRWLEKPDWTLAAFLVLLGAAVTLIKQTYAIFWLALIVYALLAALLKWDSGRVTLHKFATLSLLAAISAVISWLGYALFISAELPDVPLLRRPLGLVAAVSTQYGDGQAAMFAPDLYLRNLPNYGMAAMLLIVPGIVMAIRGSDARMRLVAVCWLVCAVCVQLIQFREARYLAFLAPLTALLIVPVIHLAFSRRFFLIALTVLVLVDQVRGVSVAAEQLVSTRSINVTRFVNSPQSDGNIFASRVLSFVYDSDSPLARDRYHGIYHLTPTMLRGLYEDKIVVTGVADPRDFGAAGIAPGDRVYFSNDTMLRRPPWNAENLPADISKLIQVAGTATTVDLVLRNDGYERKDNDGSYVMFIPAGNVGQQMPVITRGTLSLEAASALLGDLRDREQLQVTGVVVNALCQADTCRYP
jgi:hypothetical protein